jgi:hypothetical protein
VKVKLATAVGGLALILVVVLAGLRACKLTDRLSVLEGQHQALTATASALGKANVKLEAEVKRINVEKDAIIADRDKTIAAKQGQVVTGNKKLSDLEAEYATLGQDKEAKISNLQSQVATLKGNLTVAYSIIADKDAIIAAWTAKLNAQVTLTDSWKARYEAEARLHAISRQELGITARKLQVARLTGTLKSGLCIAAGGYLAYTMLKGSK